MDEVLAAVDARAALDLAQQLIRIDSTNPPGRELAVAELLLGRARDWGLEAELQPVAAGRANVIVRLRAAQPGPTLLYCGHLDTVPVGETAWNNDPFGGALHEGRIFGRGASDMKSGVAAMLVGMAALAAAKAPLPGDLVFAGVVGEEVDCAGSRFFLEAGGMKDVDWLVISEPTNLDLVTAHKGAFRLEITTYGRAAHGAMPSLGVNAILHMAEVIDRLGKLELPHDAHALLSPPTLSVNTIDGGFRTNVIPDICRVTVDIRTVPGQDHADILARIKTMILGLERTMPDFRASIAIIGEAAPVGTPETNPLVGATSRAVTQILGRTPTVRGVNYFSDASVLQPPTGVPTVLFGPGDDRLAHQVDEAVSLDALVQASRVFALLPLAPRSRRRASSAPVHAEHA